MKSYPFICLSGLLLLLGNPAFAQMPSLPNGSFEQWTTYQAHERFPPYETSNAFSQFLAGRPNVASVSGYQGQALRLESVDALAIQLPGALTNTISCQGEAKGGFYCPHQPDSLAIWLRYDIQPNDRAIIAVFYRGLTDTLAFFQDFTGTQSNWTRYSGPLLPRPVGFDTLVLGIYSSDPGQTIVPGSWIELDELSLPGGPPLPNAGFEMADTLEYEDPDHWGSPNAPSTWFNDVRSVHKSNDAATGNYALRIETTVIDFDCNPDTIGSINSGANLFGVPLKPMPFDPTHVPFHLNGQYRYSSSGEDSAVAALLFYDYSDPQDPEISQTVFKALPAATTYTPFSLAVDTTGWESLPDSFFVVFASSSGIWNENAQNFLGSILWIDDLTFGSGVSSLQGKIPHFALKVFPNPTQGNLHVSWEAEPHLTYELSVWDITGRKLLTKRVQGLGEIDLSLNYLTSGIYVFQLRNEQGQGAHRYFQVD